MPFFAKYLICRHVRMDWQTDKLIRVGLGNLRFLQVNDHDPIMIICLFIGEMNTQYIEYWHVLVS